MFRGASGGFRAAGAGVIPGDVTAQGDVTIAAGKRLLLDDGTAAAPALGFTSVPTSGLYKSTTGVGVAATGVAALTTTSAPAIAAPGSLAVAGRGADTPSAPFTLSAASDTLPNTSSYLRVDPQGAITLTSTPTISTTGAIDGQRLLIENVNGTNTFVLQDLGTLPGSKLRLVSATNRSITVRDVVELVYDATADEWRQATAVAAL